MKKQPLSRRTFLRGLGASVALPYLDAMTPAFAAAAAPITRAAFVYTANGVIMKDWTPTETGSGFVLPSTLTPIESFRDQTLVVSGLAHRNGEALGDGPGDHARAGASWLTGAHPKKTRGADIRNGWSIDQVLAEAIGQTTPLPSLEIGLEDVRMVGGCDSGYSCAYSNTISWSSPTTPLPYESNPRRVFERLFGDGETTDPGPGPFGSVRTGACSTSCSATRSGWPPPSERRTVTSWKTTWTQSEKSNAGFRTSSVRTPWNSRPWTARRAFRRPSRSTSSS